ncbi:MAG: hypothetical protein CSA49_07185 [Gammaproteobacteria bacterium]|nr:MAG: hypothetical protein CSA49_07185 [Gammaproteobacteria bacterium]
MEETVPIEPASTLVLIRDSKQGPQVLMQQRSHHAVFVGGAWVFPGGKLDADDSLEDWQPLIPALSETTAHAILHLENASSPCNIDQIHPHEAAHTANVSALAYWVAVLREAYEEAGLLLTEQPVAQTQRDLWRAALLADKLSWLQLIKDNNLSLAINGIHYLSRWVTPPGNPRRYDTRFFIGVAPADQTPSHENHEAIQTQWITPEEALAAHARSEKVLIFPTIVTLQAMCGHDCCDALIADVLNHFHRT